MRTIWSPVNEFTDMGRRVAELLGEPVYRPDVPAYRIPIDVYQTADDLHLLAYLPGVAHDAVSVEVLGRHLTVRADRPRPVPEDAAWLHGETGFGRFVRHIDLGGEVDAERAAAEWTEGVLHLRLPRAESSRPRRIPVTVGDAAQTPKAAA